MPRARPGCEAEGCWPCASSTMDHLMGKVLSNTSARSSAPHQDQNAQGPPRGSAAGVSAMRISLPEHPNLPAWPGAAARCGHTIALVLTQPDRPAGRGMKPQASAVKQFALEHGVPWSSPAACAWTASILKMPRRRARPLPMRRPMSWSWWRMVSSCRNGYWMVWPPHPWHRSFDASTFTARCCRACAVRRPSTVPSGG